MTSKDERRPARLATRASHARSVAIDGDLVRRKAEDSRHNPRGREMHVFHRDDGERLQRMLNAVQPGSYVRPHRHLSPPKAESIIVLQGRVIFVPFLEDGTTDEDGILLVDPELGRYGVDWRAGVWHTYIALAPDTVVFEVKEGPYDPDTDKEFASWAPAEGTAEADEYLARLTAQTTSLLDRDLDS